MPSTVRFKPGLARRVALLSLSQWLLLPAMALLAWGAVSQGGRPVVALLFALVPGLGLLLALRAWEKSLRRQFVREAPLPRFLGTKLCERYPQLSPRDTELVLRGLRQFFMAHLRSGRAFVAMPSRVVDAAWHEFILHTRGYELWCDTAFGRLLHHSPAEVLGRDARRNDGLRRVWFWACKEESIDPRQPSRLPLLFALDRKFGIPGGFHYVPDCREIDRQSGSDAYCGTSFGGSDGGGGGDAPGDTAGFGGADSSAGGDSGGDGGGCGGGGD